MGWIEVSVQAKRLPSVEREAGKSYLITFYSRVISCHNTIIFITRSLKNLRVIFWGCRESEDTHEKSIFLLFRQNIAMGELVQGKIV